MLWPLCPGPPKSPSCCRPLGHGWEMLHFHRSGLNCLDGPSVLSVSYLHQPHPDIFWHCRVQHTKYITLFPRLSCCSIFSPDLDPLCRHARRAGALPVNTVTAGQLELGPTPPGEFAHNHASSSASAKWAVLLECFETGEDNGRTSCSSVTAGLSLCEAEVCGRSNVQSHTVCAAPMRRSEWCGRWACSVGESTWPITFRRCLSRVYINNSPAAQSTAGTWLA